MARSVASDDWHLVSGHSEDEGSERSMATLHGGVCSRPETPAVSFVGEHSHDVGSECPPTPESERLADTVLSAPMGSSPAASGAAPAQAASSSPVAFAPVAGSGSSGQQHVPGLTTQPSSVAEVVGVDSACGSEVVGVHCLQGLSQEGPLEGFAASLSPHHQALKGQHDSFVVGRCSSPVAPEPAPGCAGAPDSGPTPALEGLVEEEKQEGEEDELDGLMLLADGWQGLDAALHLAGVDALMELLEGWARGCMAEACRAGMQNLQHCVQVTQQAVLRGASMLADGAAQARQQAQACLADVLVAAHKMLRARGVDLAHTGTDATADGKLTARAKPAFVSRGGLLVSALGLTTLTALAGLIFFMGRCRHLSVQLQHRDRELARLVVKILNLQDALQQPRVVHGPPALRHTTLLTGLSLG